MGDWNAATVIIALVILAVFLWIVIHGIRKRKRGGGCSCGGNCGACGGCSCSPGKK
ncbi:MAG TPA: FeoB-associated Cys-rich membrane protein [Candidatus Caccousia avistercoris]|nr:FeoB-associated Cys-rich membrane protein [Candidatus Caccousia avistercoris]